MRSLKIEEQIVHQGLRLLAVLDNEPRRSLPDEAWLPSHASMNAFGVE